MTDQVALLQSRGLVVADIPASLTFLSHLSYYRFSGYCLAFEDQRHQFGAQTTFEQVVAAYQFDLKLRDLLTEALEVVEVDLRAAIAYEFGRTYGNHRQIPYPVLMAGTMVTKYLGRASSRWRRWAMDWKACLAMVTPFS